jgi:hypothetical protein
MTITKLNIKHLIDEVSQSEDNNLKLSFLVFVSEFLHKHGLVIGGGEYVLNAALYEAESVKLLAVDDGQIASLLRSVSFAYIHDSGVYVDLTKLGSYDHYIELINYEKVRAAQGISILQTKISSLSPIKKWLAPEITKMLQDKINEIDVFIALISRELNQLNRVYDTLRTPNIAGCMLYNKILLAMPLHLKKVAK